MLFNIPGPSWSSAQTLGPPSLVLSASDSDSIYPADSVLDLLAFQALVPPPLLKPSHDYPLTMWATHLFWIRLVQVWRALDRWLSLLWRACYRTAAPASEFGLGPYGESQLRAFWTIWRSGDLKTSGLTSLRWALEQFERWSCQTLEPPRQQNDDSRTVLSERSFRTHLKSYRVIFNNDNNFTAKQSRW
jgi:hypothetical protein